MGRSRGERIRNFILEQAETSPGDVSRATADKFGISRQAVHKHLQQLVSDSALVRTGRTRASVYRLAPLPEWRQSYAIRRGLAEDVVWGGDIRGQLGDVPVNVLDLWHYGFTESFNNAIDHSTGSHILVVIRKSAASTQMLIADDGVGIFKKLQAALGLLDERHAVLELAKGKLTTDPRRHCGERLFFTSRMFDAFDILAGGVSFTHSFGDEEDWIPGQGGAPGTRVWMKLRNHTARTTRSVFNAYTSPETLRFTRTVVPVRLARHGEDDLIARSQAKRLLARVEQFKTVVLDFSGVDSIGQAFADEVFRVFPSDHPAVELVPVEASAAVRKMIDRARQG